MLLKCATCGQQCTRAPAQALALLLHDSTDDIFQWAMEASRRASVADDDGISASPEEGLLFVAFLVSGVCASVSLQTVQ